MIMVANFKTFRNKLSDCLLVKKELVPLYHKVSYYRLSQTAVLPREVARYCQSVEFRVISIIIKFNFIQKLM